MADHPTIQGPGNAFRELTDSLIDLQYSGMSTQQEVGIVNKHITNENQTLTSDYTSCSESSKTDPGYAAWYALMQLEHPNSFSSKFPATKYPKPGTNGASYPPNSQAYTKPSNFSDWMNTYVTGGAKWYETHLSSAFMTTVYGVYESKYSSSDKNAYTGALSNMTSLLSAEARSKEQKGQNDISLLTGLSQHLQTSQTPLSELMSTLLDGYNGFASSMTQISA